LSNVGTPLAKYKIKFVELFILSKALCECKRVEDMVKLSKRKCIIVEWRILTCYEKDKIFG
jgi:hypothetical protein